MGRPKTVLKKILRPAFALRNRRIVRSFYRKHPLPFAMALHPQALGEMLVIVPHVDDETIGMGGMLLARSSMNAATDLVWMTDSAAAGEKGDLDAMRCARAEEGRHLTGLFSLRMHGVADFPNLQSEAHTDEAVHWLVRVLKEDPSYDTVACISPVDAHPEHRWMARVVCEALLQIDFQGQILLYEVTNFLPSHWVNAYLPLSSPLYKAKGELYSVFESQQDIIDFDLFQLLNSAKGHVVGASAAEFYSKIDLPTFQRRLKALESINIGDRMPHRIGSHPSFARAAKQDTAVQNLLKDIP